MRLSNYRQVAMSGLIDDVSDLFKSEDEVYADVSKEWQEACPSGATRQPDGSCKTTSCPEGYLLDKNKGCVRYTPTNTICPTGLFYVLRGDGTHDCVSCPPGMETRSPHDPTCVPGNPYGTNAVSAAGDSIADFFTKLFNGSGGQAPAPATSGGTISPSTPIVPTIPGTNTRTPATGSPSPAVTATSARSNLSTGLLVLGAVGLVGGAVYLATR